jgi:hypothetical protein
MQKPDQADHPLNQKQSEGLSTPAPAARRKQIPLRDRPWLTFALVAVNGLIFLVIGAVIAQIAIGLLS